MIDITKYTANRYNTKTAWVTLELSNLSEVNVDELVGMDVINGKRKGKITSIDTISLRPDLIQLYIEYNTHFDLNLIEYINEYQKIHDQVLNMHEYLKISVPELIDGYKHKEAENALKRVIENLKFILGEQLYLDVNGE